jgi:anti-sigma factor RsiW
MNQILHHLRHPQEATLSAYLDGELSAKKLEKVRRHLESCASCHKTVSDIQALEHVLTGVPEISPSPSFDRNFWRQMDAGRPSPVEFSRMTRSDWGFRPVWAAATAASLALVVSLALYFGERPVSETDSFDAAGFMISENIELYEDFDMISHLELLENWDVIHEAKDS